MFHHRYIVFMAANGHLPIGRTLLGVDPSNRARRDTASGGIAAQMKCLEVFMSIKSLLIGSVAALAAVSGARAADAVVAADPEPVEYVRVCDAYGSGFFYIPGTETCLKISGYVRVQVGAENWQNAGDTWSYHYSNAATATWQGQVRGRVNFDARSDTEMGTLRSYLRLQATWVGGGDAGVAMDQAYIQLGGLDMGYSESFYVDDHISGVGNYGSHSDGGLSYGYQQNARLGYRFKGGNGFFGVVGIEFDANPNYVPDFVGKIGVEQDWGGVALAAAYDESDASVAVKGTALVKLPNMDSASLIVQGTYTNSAANTYAVVYNGGALVANWSLLGSFNAKMSDQLSASVGVQYMDLFAGGDLWLAELSAIYTPVTNFEVRGELVYAKQTALDGTLSGFVRFTRFF